MIGFIVLAAVLIAGAVGVVAFRQPVHAALSLVVTLLALAVTYVTLQAHFLAVIQVIVYAGAIMVLFLFVIMLLNIEGQAPAPHMTWLPPAAYLTALLVAAGIAVTAFIDRAPLPGADAIAALQGGSAEQVGTALFSHYVLAFQLVGVLLLTGIVGAVSLAHRGAATEQRQRRDREARAERELTHG
ncbi:MAG TPA: NADH-quinone oxidoreductase subunit J [Trueperaceae bacterium]|nr:NADH-quinone oxidoreductase subunit J [Trueperaceae bacterium]